MSVNLGSGSGGEGENHHENDCEGENYHENGREGESRHENRNLLTEDQVKELVSKQFSVFLSLIQNGQLPLPLSTQNNTEEYRLAELDKAYRPPPFIVPNFSEADKLQGYRNFKTWKNKLELSLEALMLLPFIKSEGGISVNISPARRDVLNAQTLQVLQASLSKSNNYLIQNVKSACEAFSILTKTYSTTRMRDYIQLNNRLYHIKFRPGYDPVRFITDFENCIEEFLHLGSTFPKEFLTSLFLYKIIGINDPKTIYFAFFNGIASMPEMPSFQMVKESFLQLDHESAAKQVNFGEKKGDKRKNGNDKESFNPSFQNPKRARLNESKVNDSSNVASTSNKKYTDEQFQKLKTMTAEEKRKIQCSKYSEYFHSAENCKRPGRLCFNCHNYGHEANTCPKPQRKQDKKNGK